MTPESAAAHDAEANGDGATSRAEECALFLRYNYCRHCVMRILRAHSGRRLSLRAARGLLAWQRAADRLRACLVRNNIALVKAMARRFGSDILEPAELESEGNLTLLRCVDKFDAARGYKFSTYACRAIRSGFAYRAACRARERKLAPVAYAPSFDPNDYLERRRERLEQEMVAELGEIIADNAAQLTNAEQHVLEARFPSRVFKGSRPDATGWTLQRVGASLGFSKEKVRQIQFRALGKLREVLDDRLAHGEKAAG
jgi:RNA polymerase sigma factor (sigma-70 family)